MDVKKPTLLLLISLGVLMSGRAQDVKDVPPPAAPYLATVPKSLDWTLILKYPSVPQSADGAKPRMAEVRTTKVNSLKRDLVRYTNGAVKEMWYYDTLLFWKDAQGAVSVSEMNPDAAQSLDDTSPVIASGFPGVRWVNPTFYKGVVLFEKVPSYYYANGTVEAWIDAKSKLPLAYKSGEVLYQYKFDANPSTSLTMPPEYKESWEKMQSISNARKQLKKDLERQ